MRLVEEDGQKIIEMAGKVAPVEESWQKRRGWEIQKLGNSPNKMMIECGSKVHRGKDCTPQRY
jgi:hypothetical protein